MTIQGKGVCFCPNPFRTECATVDRETLAQLWAFKFIYLFIHTPPYVHTIQIKIAGKPQSTYEQDLTDNSPSPFAGHLGPLGFDNLPHVQDSGAAL